MSLFVDTNVFLRFLTRDDAGQAAAAEKLFREAAAGKTHLVTGPPVLFELAWTLKRSYGMAPERVLAVLEAVLALPGLDLLDARAVHAALTRLPRSAGRTAGFWPVFGARLRGRPNRKRLKSEM